MIFTVSRRVVRRFEYPRRPCPYGLKPSIKGFVEGMNVISEEKMESSLQLDDRDPAIPRGSARHDQLDAGEDLVMRMIEDGLNALGENAGKVILHHIEVRYSLTRNQMPRKLDIFMEALREIFGEGSVTIERIIVRTMGQKTGMTINEMETASLPEAVECVRRRWQPKVSEFQRPL